MTKEKLDNQEAVDAAILWEPNTLTTGSITYIWIVNKPTTTKRKDYFVTIF